MAQGTAAQMVQVVHTVKPFLGLMPQQWMGVAIGMAIVALGIGAYTFWQRYLKLRDQGV